MVDPDEQFLMDEIYNAGRDENDGLTGSHETNAFLNMTGGDGNEDPSINEMELVVGKV